MDPITLMMTCMPKMEGSVYENSLVYMRIVQIMIKYYFITSWVGIVETVKVCSEDKTLFIEMALHHWL